MIFLTSQNSINKMLKKFYQPKSYLLTSMTDQLQKIMRWIGNYKSDEKAQVSRMIYEIQRLLTKNKSGTKNKTNPYWLVVFKSMLLVHELLVIGIMGNTFEDLLDVINQGLSHINQVNQSEITSISQQLMRKPTSYHLLEQQKQVLFEQQIIYSKFLKPYYNYLNKRCQLLPKGFSKKDKCYYLINLLSAACSCNEVIYKFGRYNKLDEFFVMGDFNLVLAKDIYLLYGLMKECIDFQQQDTQNEQSLSKTCRRNNETVSIQNDSNKNQSNRNKDKNEKLIISQVDDILLQTHEKLYHIFYNKYNYKKTQHYLPDWINLDQYETKSKANLYVKNSKKFCMHLNNNKDCNNNSSNNNNRSFFLNNNNKSKFYDEDQHLALDETACSIVGEKEQQNQSHSKLLSNSSHLFNHGHHNNNINISHELVQQSLEIIHDLEEFLEKFDDDV